MQIHSKPATRKNDTKKWLFIAVGVVLLGALTAYITKQPFGESAVVLFGIVALVMRVNSRILFALAVGILLLVPVAVLLFGAWHPVAGAMASFAFILLCTAIAAVVLELRRN